MCGSRQIQYDFPVTQFLVFTLSQWDPEVFGEVGSGSGRTRNWMRAFLPLGLFPRKQNKGCTGNDKWLACITQVTPLSSTTDITNGLQHSLMLSTYTALDSFLAWHSGCQGWLIIDGVLNDTYLLSWRVPQLWPGSFEAWLAGRSCSERQSGSKQPTGFAAGPG